MQKPFQDDFQIDLTRDKRAAYNEWEKERDLGIHFLTERAEIQNWALVVVLAGFLITGCCLISTRAKVKKYERRFGRIS